MSSSPPHSSWRWSWRTKAAARNGTTTTSNKAEKEEGSTPRHKMWTMMSSSRQQTRLEPRQQVKLVLVGESGAGKSCLMTRLVHDEFTAETQPTAGAFVATKLLLLDDEREIELSIWDTAGDERYRGLAPTFIKGSHVAVVVFDVTRAESFERAKSWVQELKRRMASDAVIALIGSKVDLSDSRVVMESTGRDYVRTAQLTGGYYETSAKTSSDVVTIFKAILAVLPKRLT